MSTSAAQRLSPSFPLPAPRGTAGALRAWQQAALAEYAARQPRDFLAVATPGAGKTTFALRLASDLLERRQVQAVTVVAPTEHLKRQWADAADRVGIALDPAFANGQGPVGARYDGVAVTYAQVAAHPLLHRNRTELKKTLVILDEVHHGGDALSWGDAIREAFDPAARRLALTGTPFRSDINPIPFVAYAPGADGVPPLGRRPRLRLRRRAARRRRAAGDVPVLLGADAVAHPGRRRGRRAARRADDPGPHRAGVAHGARPRGRVDARRCSPRPTAGSPRCGGACRTPAAW